MGDLPDRGEIGSKMCPHGVEPGIVHGDLLAQKHLHAAPIRGGTVFAGEPAGSGAEELGGPRAF